MPDLVLFSGCVLTRTETTTDVRRVAFGRSYAAVARVWGVSGRISKPALMRPFLVSAAACRQYIRDHDGVL